MEKETFKTSGNLENVGSIVLWDAENKEKIVVSQDDYRNNPYPKLLYVPIGILVIPASHMPDGKARMMSLKWMSCYSPEEGEASEQLMFWGDTTVGIENLNKYHSIRAFYAVDKQDNGKLNSDGFLPSDFPTYEGPENPQDTGTKWDVQKYKGITEVSLIASPYAPDGTPNPNYRATFIDDKPISNALSDFDGPGNTEKILNQRGDKNYTNWIPRCTREKDYPAASCCNMYHTIGTEQGDWYLPSCGELGYLAARLGTVASALELVGEIENLTSSNVWSSTEHELVIDEFVRNNAAYGMSLDGSFVYREYKNVAMPALAFCAL